MAGYFNRKRITALFFTAVYTAANLVPVQAFALTSGPAQPEMASFQQAGVSDMVDLFTGDFKYNIPLMDVDGYPLNLAYNSGVGMDDEASWVGLGWNLNVGAVNRQLRGLPDDFGGDEVVNEFSQKPKITIGGSVFLKPEFKGGLGNISGSFSLGVFNDNYTGIGATIGANAGLTIGLANGGSGTSGLGLNAGLGIQSSTASGVDVTPSLSLSLSNQVTANSSVSMGLSASLGYNTRSGLKDLTLGASFSAQGQDDWGKGSASFELGGSSYSFNTDPFYPKNQISYRTESGSFTPSFGGSAFLGFLGGGGTGYVNARTVKNKVERNPAYGFLYAEKGKTRPNALMDFTREKDNPIIPELPNLAVPVHTPDVYSFTSQAGSGQFRLYRGGSGIFFDSKAQDENSSTTLGLDVGIGGYFHGGVSYYKQNSTSTTQKWSRENAYADKGDFQDNTGRNPQEDPVYFRQVGEKTISNEELENQIQADVPVQVKLSGKSSEQRLLFNNTSQTPPLNNIKRSSKIPRRVMINYQTAEEAFRGGSLDKMPRMYNFVAPNFTPTTASPAHSKVLSRYYRSYPAFIQPIVDNQVYRQAHHISEMTFTDESGKRMVYGLPVYNITQEEYTFAAGQNPVVDQANNLVTFSPNADNKTVNTQGKGVDWYSTKQTQPAYATSHLLTGILSPDYVDVNNDGITDDDRGTSIKFNYSKLPHSIKWRTPTTREQNKASYNKALLADPEDEKGSIVYGEKEVWYTHSIETKTKVAYFYLEERMDGLGVQDWRGGIDTLHKQKLLKKIVLYSKADLSKPIKTVVFNYSYKLCPGVVNNTLNIREGTEAYGKLTLESVYFTYGHSPKGQNHKYVFSYANQFNPALNSPYKALSSDRWGTFKRASANNGIYNGGNNEFPYTVQDNAKANEYAGQWLLDQVKLPSGGVINVNYESDDYAYVQNKRAMTMVTPGTAPVKLAGLYSSPGNAASELKHANYVRFDVPDVPSGPLKDWFIKNYLNGSNYLFGKIYVKIANKLNVPGHEHDFVVCYARVQNVIPAPGGVYVQMEPISEGVTTNPFAIAAWQKMRMEYPKYAYPGYENRPTDMNPVGNLQATVSAILNAFKTLGELKENFYERASRKGFASEVDLSKSFFRLTLQSGKKLGGGVRVKQLSITDNWGNMVGQDNGYNVSYKTKYEYTATENGKTISSGVASYEPSIGGEENPLRQPVPYLQKIKGALNNMFYLEQPFGESFFPAPSVGYSKVTVTNVDESNSADNPNETGYSVSEFYTAREFPTLVSITGMKKTENGPRNSTSLFGGFQLHELTLSQGYTVYLNDMHGKPKAEKTFDKQGSLITSSEYIYFSKQIGQGEWQLENRVETINENGQLQPKYVGRDIEMYVDMRESEYSNIGESINLGVDVIPFFFGIPAPIPHWPAKMNDEYRLFRSASVAKVVHSYGMVQKAIKIQNGSQVSADNLAFDPYTGDVLVSRTYNEFKQPVYSTNIPAYWVNPRMGGAYQTSGTFIRDMSTDGNGIIGGSLSTFLKPGDELASSSGQVYWVVENEAQGAGYKAKRLIDQSGALVTGFSGSVKVIRSGNRNLFSASTASIVSLQNPIVNGKLKLIENIDLTSFKIIDAQVAKFDEKWAAGGKCTTCPDGYELSQDSLWCEIPAIPAGGNCFKLCPGDMLFDNYGVYGTDFRQYSNSAWTHRNSWFWGGNCASYLRTNTTTTQAPANFPPVKSPEERRQDSLRRPDNPGGNGNGHGNGNGNGNGSGNGSGQALTSDPASMVAVSPCSMTPYTRTSQGYCGRLLNSGIWFCNSSGNERLPVNKWIGLETYVTAPTAKTYYVGYGSDNGIRVYVNGTLLASQTNFTSVDNFRKWYVVPVSLNAGKNLLKIEMYNAGSYATAGVEVYNNTYQELMTVEQPNVIFSTNDLLTKRRVYTYMIESNGAITPSYTCPGGGKPSILDDVSCGRVAVERRVNPYVAGFLGNWRSYESKVYQVNRSYGNQATASQSGVNARKDGHYDNFHAYWYYNTQAGRWDSSATKWVTSSTVTLYDQQGQEMENRNALGHYSSALFGFRGNVSTAVASNARHREIFYESFEDLNFRASNTYGESSCNGAMGFDNYTGNLVNTISHTGRHALSLASTVTLNAKTSMMDHRTQEYMDVNNRGEYLYRNVQGLYSNGFEPVRGNPYIVSVWVKDGNPQSKTPAITIQVEGGNVQLTWKATVEGWKLFEGMFNPYNTQITISGSPGVYIDDFRIFPLDGLIKSYAYDPLNYKLMAELDENNFATLYEYDDEGILNRVKKETEKGIVTIKETRSTYRKN
jgi:hypothetical protein